MRLYRQISTLPLALLLAGFLTAPNSIHAKDSKSSAKAPKESREVNDLLADVRKQSVILSTDADRMQAYVREGVSRQSDSAEIDQMRNHINQAGKELSQLQQLRAGAAPWQMEAIDHVRPLLQELADNTEQAIKFISNRPQEDYFEPKFRSYLEANAHVASSLSSMIGDFISYGRTKDRMKALSTDVSSPSAKK